MLAFVKVWLDLPCINSTCRADRIHRDVDVHLTVRPVADAKTQGADNCRQQDDGEVAGFADALCLYFDRVQRPEGLVQMLEEMYKVLHLTVPPRALSTIQSCLRRRPVFVATASSVRRSYLSTYLLECPRRSRRASAAPPPSQRSRKASSQSGARSSKPTRLQRELRRRPRPTRPGCQDNSSRSTARAGCHRGRAACWIPIAILVFASVGCTSATPAVDTGKTFLSELLAALERDGPVGGWGGRDDQNH